LKLLAWLATSDAPSAYAILDALFAPLTDPEASAQDKHHAALRILERVPAGRART
jgi:hypothetical protein